MRILSKLDIVSNVQKKRGKGCMNQIFSPNETQENIQLRRMIKQTLYANC